MIFDLLQNRDTLVQGRQLLRLECQAQEQSTALDSLIRQCTIEIEKLDKITKEEQEFAAVRADIEGKIKKLKSDIYVM